MTQKQMDDLSVIERLKAPTPKFFQKLKTGSLLLAAISAAILTAPIALPSIVVTIAGYMALAGTVAGVVSQITVES